MASQVQERQEDSLEEQVEMAGRPAGGWPVTLALCRVGWREPSEGSVVAGAVSLWTDRGQGREGLQVAGGAGASSEEEGVGRVRLDLQAVPTHT